MRKPLGATPRDSVRTSLLALSIVASMIAINEHQRFALQLPIKVAGFRLRHKGEFVSLLELCFATRTRYQRESYGQCNSIEVASFAARREVVFSTVDLKMNHPSRRLKSRCQYQYASYGK